MQNFDTSQHDVGDLPDNPALPGSLGPLGRGVQAPQQHGDGGRDAADPQRMSGHHQTLHPQRDERQWHPALRS